MDNPLFSHLNEQEEGDRDSVDGAFKAVCRFVKYTNAFRLRPEWKAEDERPMLMAAGAVSDPLIDEDEQTSSYTCHDEHLLMVSFNCMYCIVSLIVKPIFVRKCSNRVLGRTFTNNTNMELMASRRPTLFHHKL